jgi:NAD(P)-dependent dehydrogenase (short-subunit alcohol dehydrogenase family)
MRELVDRGWSVVIDGRDGAALDVAARERARIPATGQLVAVAGDVTDVGHRLALVRAVEELGGVDLVVNNAGILGPSPQPPLSDYPLDVLREVYEVNVIAPLGVVQAMLPLLRRSPHPRVLNITSDASVEAYVGWGGYGSAKAALDHLGRVLCVEEPELRVWNVDPGDMATEMQQAAFPDQDISDRPAPETVVATLADLAESDRPSGRYTRSALLDTDPLAAR